MGLLMLRPHAYSSLCRDLFLLAQTPDESAGRERGSRWESQITTELALQGYPVECAPGGIRVFGVLPASGLRHQTDAAIDCVDAHVLGEWKSYRGPVPKNEVLRFKATSDDLYDALIQHRPRRPVLRLFGVRGDASRELRWYAARHGITLVERTRWPAPVLADVGLPWPPGEGPGRIDRGRLAWLSRPLQRVYPHQPDGSLRLPRPLPDAAVEALLDLHDCWSDRLWDTLDSDPMVLEQRLFGLPV
jgi:hypothetical protein